MNRGAAHHHAQQGQGQGAGVVVGPAPRGPMKADAQSTTVTRAATRTSGPCVVGSAPL